MRRIICFALFGLLVSSEAAFSQGQHGVRPRGVVGPRFRWHPGIFHQHHYSPRHRYFDPFRYFVQDFTTAYTAPESIVPFSPTYFFLPSVSASRPQLILKNDTIYTVSDYWRVDDQLHFVTVEESGTKSVPHTVPFEDLDVQRTTAAAVAQGFRFVVRDEPIEQWLQHHAHDKASAPKRRSRQRSD
jgi:hypothetical protein